MAGKQKVWYTLPNGVLVAAVAAHQLALHQVGLHEQGVEILEGLLVGLQLLDGWWLLRKGWETELQRGC